MIAVNGVNKVGYERKKKTQKTKETQYVDADDHPFQSRIFRNSGMSFNKYDGDVLSSLIPR